MFNKDHNDPAELVILSLLESGPMYGYAISKEVAARSDNQLRLTPGVLYPLLRQLETDGLIAASWEEVKSERSEDDADGRKRKWYRLSAKGKKRLQQRIDAHRAYQALINAFLPGAPKSKEQA